MIQIVADTHSHTVACDHAYSTIGENVAQAKKRGLQFLAMTEHCSNIPGAPTDMYFRNLGVLPRVMDGVILLRGAETNIMDFEGAIDLPETPREQLEWIIASYHTPCIKPSTERDHTKGWMSIANNPRVHVIGHCGDPRYAFEHKPVVREFARTGKIVEINCHSFKARPGSPANCRHIAELCAEYGVPVVLSTDAHCAQQIGDVRPGAALLEEIEFPEELILNADYDRFLAVAREKSGQTLTDGK